MPDNTLNPAALSPQRPLPEPPLPDGAHFFVTGGTLPGDASCYVTRRADTDLMEALRAGEYAYVLTARQMGKSSLMVRTAARLRREGVAVAVLDLSALGQNLTPAQWYFGQLLRIGRQLDLENELEDHWCASDSSGGGGGAPALSPLQRWRSALEEVVLARVPGRVVLFVDEIDAVRSLPFSADEYFTALRELYNRRTEEPELARLTVCLLGVATPSRLIQDVRTTPFNIGRRIELTDFTRAEAEPLARALGPRGASLLSRVLYWTGGHPYLTMRLCREVAADTALPPTARTPADVDRRCAALFLASGAREREDNLLFVRESILRGGSGDGRETDRTALLDLYGRVRAGRIVRDNSEENLTAAALRLSGIVRRDRLGHLRVRNRIYAHAFDAEWVRANLPDAELRRQAAAYRRGLFRAGTVSLTVLVTLSWLVVAAKTQEKRALRAEEQMRTERDWTTRLLFAADLNLVQHALQDENVARARQILVEHRRDPAERSTFEWRYLWKQANRAERVLAGGTYPTRAVWRSPDGATLLAVDSAGVLRRWSATGSQPNAEAMVFTSNPANPIVEEEPVWEAAFSPDGTTLVVGGTGGRFALIETATGRQRHERADGNGLIRSIAFFPDGKRFVTGRPNLISVWDTATGDLLQELPSQPLFGKEKATPMSIAVSPDGQRLLIGYQRGSFGEYTGSIALVDLPSARPVWQPRTFGTPITTVAFSPDGKRAFVSEKKPTLHLLDVATGKSLPFRASVKESVWAAAFSPGGNTLVTVGGDQAIRLWDGKTGAEQEVVIGQTRTLRCLAFTPEGEHLVTGGDEGGVQVWPAHVSPSPRHLSLPGELRGRPEAPVVHDLSPDGRYLATGNFRGELRLWEIATGRVVRTFGLKGTSSSGKSSKQAPRGEPATQIMRVAFMKDGEHLLSGTRAGQVTLWNIRTGEAVRSVTLPAGPNGRPRQVDLLAVAQNGRVAAASSTSHTVYLWKPQGDDSPSRTKNHENAELVALTTAPAHTRALTALALSPDGQTLATGSEDQMVILWDIATGTIRHRMAGHGGTIWTLTFTPDSRSLASGGGDTRVMLWDVATGRETLQLPNGNTSVASLSFTEDGTQLRGVSDGHLLEWDARLPEEE
jgi:FOG: WD40 repeat